MVMQVIVCDVCVTQDPSVCTSLEKSSGMKSTKASKVFGLKWSKNSQYVVTKEQEDLDLDFLAALKQCELMMLADIV